MGKFLFHHIIISTLFCASVFAQGTWQAVSNFGNNPGNLNAYEYIPTDMPPDAPLVVVMHGCTQNATSYANESGWNTLADAHKFYVIHAEQKSANHSTNCFNYWEPGDHNRGQGEAKSIKQMVDYMKSNYSIDNNKVFATGLSAGGAMTVVMLSAYPNVFAAGAEMAGLPYKVATSSGGVFTAALGLVSKTAQQWGDLVRNEYPSFSGTYPRMAIFHGTSDIIINENNAEETMKQYTNLHNTDQTADETINSFNGNADVRLKRYENSNGEVVIERYILDGMAHGIAVDPGSCDDRGGATGANAIDFGLFSSYWAADFFGILQDLPLYEISGPDSVFKQQQNVNFSVPQSPGSIFQWQFPMDVNVVNGSGTNSITVNWGNSSGDVELTETTAQGCDLGPISFHVTAIDSFMIIDTTGNNDTTVVDTTGNNVDTTGNNIDTTGNNIDTTGNNIDTTTNIIKRNVIKKDILIRQSNGLTEYLIRSSVNQSTTVRIHGLAGRLIEETSAQTNQYYSIPHELPPGIYILKCTTTESQLTKKIWIY